VTGVLVLAKTGLNQSAILLHFCIKRLFRRIAPVEGTRGSPRWKFFFGRETCRYAPACAREDVRIDEIISFSEESQKYLIGTQIVN
jgi:hypothetical protein